MSLKSFKSAFLSFFRELFVYHHTSLEFRAKLFAAIISSNKNDTSCQYEILKKIAEEIYKEDVYRVDVLIRTTKEYVDKIINNDSLNIDYLLLDIDKELRKNKRFVKKINIEHLHRLKSYEDDEESEILQIRILEFFENEIKSRVSL